MSDSIDRAITLLQAAARSKPDDFELNLRLMTAWLQKQNFKAVVGQFRTIVQARPDWTQFHYDLLDRLARDGHVQKLHQAFKSEIAESVADSITLYGMGLLLQAVEQPDAAEPFFKRAIAVDPALRPSITISASCTGCRIEWTTPSRPAAERLRRAPRSLNRI